MIKQPFHQMHFIKFEVNEVEWFPAFLTSLVRNHFVNYIPLLLLINDDVVMLQHIPSYNLLERSSVWHFKSDPLSASYPQVLPVVDFFGTLSSNACPMIRSSLPYDGPIALVWFVH